ncbi:hypothetical protein F3W84_21925 [Ochrobactrum quorumnocens]|uniref:Uncharacterized protein n=1 Tax=Ochrobactrum quorumnocens TaxID=271865 RepID=A0A5N1JPE5_9HYPH|nr:hypothetical protein F3W84_21925 [[Ochrobactrum] quorumnocens]
MSWSTVFHVIATAQACEGAVPPNAPRSVLRISLSHRNGIRNQSGGRMSPRRRLSVLQDMLSVTASNRFRFCNDRAG